MPYGAFNNRDGVLASLNATNLNELVERPSIQNIFDWHMFKLPISDSTPSNALLFVSEQDEEIVIASKQQMINAVNAGWHLTIITMGDRALPTHIRDIDNRIDVIAWTIETEETPHNWEVLFWRAYDCGQLSRQEKIRKLKLQLICLQLGHRRRRRLRQHKRRHRARRSTTTIVVQLAKRRVS